MKQICKDGVVNDNFTIETENSSNSAINSMKKLSSALLMDGSGWGELVEHKYLNCKDKLIVLLMRLDSKS